MLKKLKIKSRLSIYIGILLTILLSGSYLYTGYYRELLTLAVGFILYTIVVKRFQFSVFIRCYAPFMILITLVNIVVNGIGSLMFLTFIIGPLFTYSLVSSISYDDFKKAWLNVMCLISLWSLFVFILVQLGIQTEVPSYSDKYELLMGINVRVRENRLCGLSFEPGVFQILLIYTLLMWIDNIKLILSKQSLIIKFFVCFMALLATQSTMGYLALLVVCGSVFFKTGIPYKRKIKYIVIGGIIITPIAYYVITGDVVQNKINEEDGNMSYTIRLMDNIALWNVFMENPIFGAGIETRKWEVMATAYGNETASNGVLAMLSRVGIFWIILYVIFLYINSKKIGLHISPLYFVLVVLLPLCNEDIAYTPIAYIFALPFLRINSCQMLYKN